MGAFRRFMPKFGSRLPQARLLAPLVYVTGSDTVPVSRKTLGVFIPLLLRNPKVFVGDDAEVV